LNDIEYYLKKAGVFHGHICIGIFLGTKMTLAAMKVLGMDPETKNKHLLVYTEVDRCMTDAVQAITGCSLGHRSLKFVDYGKFAATFVNLKTGKAVRATIKGSFDSKSPVEEVHKIVVETPDEELVILQEVEVQIPETDLPGPARRKTYCSICGERIVDGRELNVKDKLLCRPCVNNKYYKEIFH
jgi:formylmethanofuran dehydrogenase subunit E